MRHLANRVFCFWADPAVQDRNCGVRVWDLQHLRDDAVLPLRLLLHDEDDQWLRLELNYSGVDSDHTGDPELHEDYVLRSGIRRLWVLSADDRADNHRCHSLYHVLQLLYHFLRSHVHDTSPGGRYACSIVRECQYHLQVPDPHLPKFSWRHLPTQLQLVDLTRWRW